MKLITLLSAIGSTEVSTFQDICAGLADEVPAKGDKEAWWQMFNALRDAERRGLIETEKDKENRLETAILTEAGVAYLKQQIGH